LTKTEPIRRCIGCGQRKLKKNLIRMVILNNQVLVDTKQRLGGRGFYLCKDISCIYNAKKSKKIEKIFKIEDVSKFYEELINNIRNDWNNMEVKE